MDGTRDGICLPATTESVAEVSRRIVVLARDVGLEADESHRLRLATEEIVANVVAHGYHRGHAPTAPREVPSFEVRWGSDATRVWVCVIDSAKPFDPTAAAEPIDLDTPLDRRTPGGLGIHLVRSALDEFSYRRDGAQNRVTLAVCRGRTATPRPARTATRQDGGRDGTPDSPDHR